MLSYRKPSIWKDVQVIQKMSSNIQYFQRYESQWKCIQYFAVVEVDLSLLNLRQFVVSGLAPRYNRYINRMMERQTTRARETGFKNVTQSIYMLDFSSYDHRLHACLQCKWSNINKTTRIRNFGFGFWEISAIDKVLDQIVHYVCIFFVSRYSVSITHHHRLRGLLSWTIQRHLLH